MNEAPDAARWQRVRELFDLVSNLPAAERAPFLEASCGGDVELRRELESLLAHDPPDDAETGLDRRLRRDIGALAATLDAGRALPDHLGRYRILSEIGRGGMGTVYLAERDDELRTRVAIKIGRTLLGADGERRFREERQILARLQHPNIAALLDGGTTPDGLPYLVMELVEGSPIDDYCDQHALDIRQRVELFRIVCGAVSHAHRGLVIHRDLKPSNILVGADGQPKLLDFGIAKLIDDSLRNPLVTAPLMRLMTKDYASPEQVCGGPMTTATDVYSLGTLLFKILTGARPYNPVAAHRIKGDLDAIVIKAVQEDADQRYASVDDLSQDLQRFLDRRPVAARRATWSYRPLRFIRRHPVGVATATAFAVIVATLTISLTAAAARVASERDAAARVSSMLVRIFNDARSRTAESGTLTTRELLDRAADQIRRELPDQPAVRARLLDALGAIYAGRGFLEPAQAVLSEAMDARRVSGSPDSAASARTLGRLADTLRLRGEYAAAEQPARQSLDILARASGRRNPETARAMLTLGQILRATGRNDEAAALFQEAVDIFATTLGPSHPMVSQTMQNIARTQLDRNELEAARTAANRSLVIALQTFVPQAVDTASMLADVVEREGRADEAAALRREADGFSRLLGSLGEQRR